MTTTDAQFARAQLQRVRDAIADIPPGVSSISIGGESVSYEDLKKDLQFWEAKVATAEGTRTTVEDLDLS